MSKKYLWLLLLLFFVTGCTLQKSSAYSDRCKSQNVQKESMYYVQTKQFQKAADLATFCLEENPQWYQMYNNRGLAYKNLGKYDLAMKDFQKAISINPNYLVSYISIANLKLQKKDYQGALEEADKIIAIAPNFPAVYRLRGTIKLCLKDYQGALDDFNKTYSLDKNFPYILDDIKTAEYALRQKAIKGSNYNPTVDVEVKNTVIKLQKK